MVGIAIKFGNLNNEKFALLAASTMLHRKGSKPIQNFEFPIHFTGFHWKEQLTYRG